MIPLNDEIIFVFGRTIPLRSVSKFPHKLDWNGSGMKDKIKPRFYIKTLFCWDTRKQKIKVCEKIVGWQGYKVQGSKKDITMHVSLMETYFVAKCNFEVNPFMDKNT